MGAHRVLADVDPEPNPVQDPGVQPGATPPPPGFTPEPPEPFHELFSLDPATVTNDRLQDIVNRQVEHDVSKSGLDASYTLLVLHDDHILMRDAADRIYEAAAGADRDKPLLLVLQSSGGDVAAAYLIAKLCREHTKGLFEVAVPRRAKSAATLICCGADRIHMGSLSELGPIDPQLRSLPALALKHSVELIAQLANQYPGASAMFSEYLAKSLPVEALGHL